MSQKIINQESLVGTDFTASDCIDNEERTFYIKVGDTKCTFDIKIKDTIVQGFPFMIALHYVFNVTYSEKIEATMTSIQLIRLQIKDKLKKPPKFLSLICHIKKLGS